MEEYLSETGLRFIEFYRLLKKRKIYGSPLEFKKKKEGFLRKEMRR